MRGFLALLKVNFTNILVGTINMGGKRRKKFSASAALVLMGALMVFISAVYSLPFMMEFAPLGGANVVLMSMLILAVFFPLVLTLFGAIGIVFSAQDADLVFSLPVSAFTVMLSRVAALYLEALFMTELILLPAAVVYMLFGGGSVLSVLLLLVVGIFLALIPAIFSLVLGFLVSFIVARLPFKNLLTVLFSLLFIGGIMVGSFTLSATMGSEQINVTSLQAVEEAMVSAVPPLGWAVYGAVRPAPLQLLLLAAATVLPLLLLVWVFSLFYKSIITKLSSHKLKTNYRLRGVASSGHFSALFKKEAGKFFGTPMFLLNSGIMPLLIMGLSVYALVKRDTIQDFIAQMLGFPGADAILGYLPLILMGLLAFAMSVVYSSAVSISLEGKYLWILKEAPLSPGKIFAAKVLFNFAIDAALVLISAPLLGYALAIPWLDIALVVLVCLLFGAFTSTVFLFINLMFPRFDYISEMQVIKNSASVLLAMLAGVLTMLLVAGVYWLSLVLGLGFTVFALLASLLLALLLAGTIAILQTRGRRIFEEL